MTRIALFGGTFDPPHNAHLALAHAALAALDLAEVRWIPAGQPWQKTGHGGQSAGGPGRAVTAAEHRVAMVQAAIAGAGGERRFTLERLEVDRAGPSYTLDTVRELSAREPGREWVLLIGQDQYAGLHTWRDWRELLARVTLAVANRPGDPSGKRREPAAEVRAFAHRVVPLPMIDISSTDVRRRVAAGLPIGDLVPAEVAGYIDRHGLYRH